MYSASLRLVVASFYSSEYFNNQIFLHTVIILQAGSCKVFTLHNKSLICMIFHITLHTLPCSQLQSHM